MSAKPRAGLVYFIKPAGLDGPIKIGHSWCPENRLIDLSAWSPWPLQLIGCIPGRGEDERFLHQCFADCHSHREWFHSTQRLRDTIDKILKAGNIEAIRADLKPIGSIRLPRKNSPESTKRMSYRMRVYWALQKLKKSATSPGYFKAPTDVSEIMDRWHQGYRRVAQQPTLEEIARLDAFLSNVSAEAVFVEIKLKVVA